MKMTIDDKTFEPFIEFNMIEKRLRLMGIQLNLDYEDKVPIFICVLNGAFMFMADLMKEVHIGCETTFVKVASYHGDTKSSGNLIEQLPLLIDIKGRDVIVVEDIVDTGRTLKFLLEKIYQKEPASVKVATLLLKPDALEYQFDEISFVGFEIANDFVVGYGLDYKGLGRNMADIYRLVGQQLPG
ncbi:MAG: hypoxanthine phosphoribosyltransferase [Bacteroidetes bacterium]|nr:hypoxanthine phosphoribosyltransferase [Bacteroidota bacterium]MBU1371726.1 hypoxanthine phosphoribosyltransferase [Bacteroidota bacterium]MBU1483731.1 hypoxanthine phosphoribosyltransferase [Bacteroidota bacterium]MBU1759306.1 hypoxanthine phosphoribosyltransferase [Bacteroidota bacterium]MBU2045890.1 hypoxanthine phosphoribosyltransferase [Bacteroidota bacterium]